MVFVGDDWAKDHHDVELVDDNGRRLARARLPEGMDGVSRLHALIAEHAPPEWADLDPDEVAARVRVGIETDRGPWVQALVAAGYRVYPINPMSVARYRERHSTSGAKSDAGDAHVLAEIVRLDHTHHRPIAGDSPQAEAMKLVARTHQTLVWDRSRQLLRLRSTLREFFPAALRAFDDLTAPDALHLLSAAPTRTGPPACPAPRSSPGSTWPTAVTPRPRPPTSRTCCAPTGSASPPRCKPPTPRS
jgi:transposase